MRPLIRSVLGLVSGVVAAGAVAAPIAGDIAIIRRDTSADTFAFVTLAEIAANERIYFTDNGWRTSGNFKDSTLASGRGNEGLVSWQASSLIPAGTVVTSYVDDARWAWTSSGKIDGATGSYAKLDLAQGGDQIYAFQASAARPLSNVTTHLYVLDDTVKFEDAIDGNTGAIPLGLTTDVTALALNKSGATNKLIGIDGNLLTGTATQQDWLTFFAKADHWTNAPAALPGTINVSLPATPVSQGGTSSVPEPSTTWLLGIAAVAVVLRHKR